MDGLTKDEIKLMEQHAAKCEACRFTLCEVYGSRTNFRWIRCDGCGERMQDRPKERSP